MLDSIFQEIEKLWQQSRTRLVVAFELPLICFSLVLWKAEFAAYIFPLAVIMNLWSSLLLDCGYFKALRFNEATNKLTGEEGVDRRGYLSPLHPEFLTGALHIRRATLVSLVARWVGVIAAVFSLVLFIYVISGNTVYWLDLAIALLSLLHSAMAFALWYFVYRAGQDYRYLKDRKPE